MFAEVFVELSAILRPYADRLDCKADTADRLYVDTFHVMKNRKPLFFGSVEIRKAYVSYHLMPVYVNPALLDDISPVMKKRMQGKSCFNFKAVDEGLFEELSGLTEAGFQDYVLRGYV